MKWFAIIALFIAAFGPILWLLPKPRDRRISRLRMAARQKGLMVELSRVSDPQPRPEDRVSSGGALRSPIIRCACYRLLANTSAGHIEPWRLERGDSSVETRLGLCWQDLPPDWLAVEVDARAASLYWREEVSEENLGERLEGVSRLLTSLLVRHQKDHDALQEGIAGD